MKYATRAQVEQRLALEQKGRRTLADVTDELSKEIDNAQDTRDDLKKTGAEKARIAYADGRVSGLSQALESLLRLKKQE